MKEEKYFAAAYLRLSKDDEDIDGSIKSESNSISSQREIVRSFIREQEDMELFDIYVDDGYSGANFNRPEFRRMMSDIEAGNVNCVIVKDLSRFGRDYIEAGRLIQKTFPAFHVRFIAVTDSFDSETADEHTKSLVLPVKNFINDSYSRDISQKVKSQQRIKWAQGKYTGSYTSYGYKKTEEDRNRLRPDDYAAEIVRKIFAWKMEGMSASAIARRLNDLGVLSPLEYKQSQGQKISGHFRTHVTAKWSPVAVKRILTNEIYTGVMVQGKREVINYKVKKMIDKPKKEWVRVEGTHEAIVSHEDFEIVQQLLTVDTRANAGARCAHLFSGLLYCGDCGEPMLRRVNRYKDTATIYFICSTRNRGQGCTRHSIPESELKEVIFQVLQTYISLFLDVSSQTEYLQKTEVRFEGVSRFDGELRRLRKEQEKYLELQKGLYEDVKTGLITKTDYRNFRAVYEEQYEEAKKALDRQEEMIQTLFCSGVASGIRLQRFQDSMKLTELNRDALLCLISRIEVYEGKKVCVKFRGKEEFW